MLSIPEKLLNHGIVASDIYRGGIYEKTDAISTANDSGTGAVALGAG
jgi:hypothetical protein